MERYIMVPSPKDFLLLFRDKIWQALLYLHLFLFNFWHVKYDLYGKVSIRYDR